MGNEHEITPGKGCNCGGGAVGLPAPTGGYRPMGPDPDEGTTLPTPEDEAEHLATEVQVTEPRVVDAAEVDAFENGLRREVEASRPGEPMTISGAVAPPWSYLSDEDDEAQQARLETLAEALEAIAEAEHGVTSPAKDRARAAAAALRWALDPEAPSPLGEVL